MPEASVFQIPIDIQLADRSEESVRKEVQAALAEAISDAKECYDVEAETEVEGGFMGVGETTLILTASGRSR